MQRIRGRRLEPRVDGSVEGGRPFRLGVDEQRADAHALSDSCGLEQRVPDQGSPQSPALLRDVDTETGQDDDGDRVAPDARVDVSPSGTYRATHE